MFIEKDTSVSMDTLQQKETIVEQLNRELNMKRMRTSEVKSCYATMQSGLTGVLTQISSHPFEKTKLKKISNIYQIFNRLTPSVPPLYRVGLYLSLE